MKRTHNILLFLLVALTSCGVTTQTYRSPEINSSELLLAGEANYTEVLSAEQNLLQARLNRVNDHLEQLQYSVELYRAAGGGIK